MKPISCCLLGLPVDDGASQRGCRMGPDAYRTAGLSESIRSLGHRVTDLGNLAKASGHTEERPSGGLDRLPDVSGWIEAIVPVVENVCARFDLPVFLGGDHSIAAGTLPGVTAYADALGQPQFVLWLDAHPDLHSLKTTTSGNLHGTPVAYALGSPGFEDYPALRAALDPAHVCMMGIRSVDPAERRLIGELGLEVHDMRDIDENGMKAPLVKFLERVGHANGRLHVSLDVDFLDPSIAPAVGTTVPGGATFREAHFVMELLHDSGLVTSLDLVELNPFLDHVGRTAVLMSDLCASLLGRTVLDRTTPAAA